MASILRRIRGEVDEVDRRSNSLIESEDSFSRHSSVQGPYREGLTDTSFPVYCTVKSQSRGAGIYTRSILSLGHGLGVYNVAGDISRPKYHIAQGAFLGDVGYLNERGTFLYCFNIFYPLDHPIQLGTLPPKFSPIDSPLSPESVRTIPNHFPPGTILCSEGIKETRTSDSPLKAEFSTKAREGAVLVLPEGTMREELLNPSLIHAYVKEHAASWYQFFNGDNDDTAETPVANGTIWIVTSVDRAKSWAMATFPSQNVNMRYSKEETQFQYNAEDKFPWDGDSRARPLEYDVGNASEGEVGAVLLGVTSVALSPSQWSRNVAYIPPQYVRSCPVLSAPAIGLQARIQQIIDYIKGTMKPPTLDNPVGDFHPSVMLLHILLLSDPSATVAVIDDSVWIPQLNKRILTHPEVVGLIQRVFDACNIVNTEGLITLVPKQPQDILPVATSQENQVKRSMFTGYHILSRSSRKKHVTEPKSIVRQNMAKVLWLPE